MGFTANVPGAKAGSFGLQGLHALPASRRTPFLTDSGGEFNAEWPSLTRSGVFFRAWPDLMIRVPPHDVEDVIAAEAVETLLTAEPEP